MPTDTAAAAEHVTCAAMLNALRVGRFPEAYAELFADAPLRAGELIAIGREIEHAMRTKSYARRADRLRRTVARLIKEYLRGERAEDAELIVFIHSIVDLAYRQQQRDTGTPISPDPMQARAFGHVLAHAQKFLEHDLPLVVPALVQVAYETAYHHREALSRTDIARAVRTFTEHVSLEQWLGAKV